MPTNDERREVAAKLRELSGVKWLDTFPHWEEAVMESWHSIRQLLDSEHINPDEDHEEICNRLADLIEPEPEWTCRMEIDWDYDGGCPAYYRDYVCSECKEDFIYYKNSRVSYCPNCGAKVVE